MKAVRYAEGPLAAAVACRPGANPLEAKPLTCVNEAPPNPHMRRRRLLEAQIRETLDLEGSSSVCRLVSRLYGHVDRRQHPAAARTVLAHLIKLADEGQVDCCDGLPTLRAVYRIRR